MAHSEGKRHVNQLPDELFAKILDLVPIKNVFADMRVSKRWENVCRQAVRTRKSLIIGTENWLRKYPDPVLTLEWDWRREQSSKQLDKIRGANEWLVPMMESLKRMENIKHLCVSQIDSQNVRKFVRKLADQLTLLEVHFAIGDIATDIVFPHLTHLRCRHFDAETASAFPKLTELFIDEPVRLPVMRLPSLKKLLCDRFPDKEPIKQFMISNAENLESLEVAELELRFDRPVMFRNLTELKIYDMDEDVVKSLPAIRHLVLRDGAKVAVLDRLPAAQMLSLDIRFDFDPAASGYQEEDEDEEEGLDEFTAVISQMSNLKQLSISDFFNLPLNGKKDPTHALSSMFGKLCHLEKVSIATDNANFVGFNWDSVMFSLVQQNPNLRDVYFSGIVFTAAAYASLAQLQHLSLITVRNFSQEDDVSFGPVQTMTDNILTLLRGSSRNVIRELRVWEEDVDIAQVTPEVELMAQERGSKFEKADRSRGSSFKFCV